MSPESRSRLLRIAIWFTLVLGVIAIYAQTVGFEYINFDDNSYVYDNRYVTPGLTVDGIRWAFTNHAVGNWTPVTMLSHQAASSVFGDSPGGHHAVNVLLHLISAALLLLFLERATGDLLPSAFCALVFAVHPLHVESVAWVSERKDVLSAVFFFLTLIAYVDYVRKRKWSFYILALFAFGLGLLAKPMLVTVPFVLLLLDYWPLARSDWRRAVLEKLPYVGLALADAIGTFYIQSSIGAVQSMPFGIRVSNAFVSYIKYLQETVWPANLAIFYPYPDKIPLWQPLAAVFFLAVITAAVLILRRSKPSLAVGWLWFVGMLVPVAGFVQPGFQAHADRYMYLPMVGLTIMLAWGIPRRFAVVPVAGVAILILTVLAVRQTSYWSNSEKLYTHALQVTGDNWLIEGNLGTYIDNIPGRRGEAMMHLETALRLKPDFPQAHNNLGSCLANAGIYDSAIEHYRKALLMLPNDPRTHVNLGRTLVRIGRYQEAVGHFEIALQKLPDWTEVRSNLEEAKRLARTTQVAR